MKPRHAPSSFASSVIMGRNMLFEGISGPQIMSHSRRAIIDTFSQLIESIYPVKGADLYKAIPFLRNSSRPEEIPFDTRSLMESASASRVAQNYF